MTVSLARQKSNRMAQDRLRSRNQRAQYQDIARRMHQWALASADLALRYHPQKDIDAA